MIIRPYKHRMPPITLTRYLYPGNIPTPVRDDIIELIYKLDMYHANLNTEWYSQYPKDTPESWLEHRNSREYNYTIAYHRNKAIGIITYRKYTLDTIPFGYDNYLTYTHHDTLWVSQLFVMEEYRHTGVAYRLMEDARHYAKENGMIGLVVMMMSENVNAEAFYIKYGFKMTEFYSHLGSITKPTSNYISADDFPLDIVCDQIATDRISLGSVLRTPYHIPGVLENKFLKDLPKDIDILHNGTGTYAISIIDTQDIRYVCYGSDDSLEARARQIAEVGAILGQRPHHVRCSVDDTTITYCTVYDHELITYLRQSSAPYDSCLMYKSLE